MSFLSLPVHVHYVTPNATASVALPDPLPGMVDAADMPDRNDFTAISVIVYIADNGEVCTSTVEGGTFGEAHNAKVMRDREHIVAYGGTVINVIEGEVDHVFGRASVWSGR